jgi:acyl-CoA synthetase (AMP-forming)/AMP-acid ligase II
MRPRVYSGHPLTAVTRRTPVPVSSPLGELVVADLSLPAFLLEHAAAFGDRPAFVDGTTGRSLSYAELGPLVERFATGLAACGFGRGDVLALAAANSPDWPIALLGAQLAGGAVTPLNPLWTAEEIAHQLQFSHARLVVADAASLAGVRAAGASDVVVLGDAPQGTRSFAALLETDAPLPVVSIDPTSDLAFLPYSSGTTGLPKGVQLTHRNLVANTAQSLALLSFTPRDVLIGALPFFHAAGFITSVCMALRAGSTVVTMPRFELEQWLRLVEEHRATVLTTAPPMVLALARHPAVDRYDLSSLEVVGCGAAPLSAELETECAARLDRPVVQAYGITECSAVVAMSRRDGAGRTSGAAGTLVPGTQARLIDPATGTELRPGDTGELCIRGPQVMSGYLGNPAATAATVDPEGWLHTGDLGTVTADGEVVLVDRVKELIKVSGFQVAPAELEALLGTHPAVADAAVVGRPDERSGERPVAFVVPRGALDPDELVGWAAQRTAGYKCLSEVVVVDAVPRSPSGKILRRLLRDQLVPGAGSLPVRGDGGNDPGRERLQQRGAGEVPVHARTALTAG